MRILLIHNKYQNAGGEDVVFQAESTLLSSYGNEVDEVVFDNAEIKSTMDKLLSGLRLIYNPVSARILNRKISQFHPDVIHVHNFVPLASPSVFFVARKHNIPVILTLHNYRLICPGNTLFYKDRIYEKSIHSLFAYDAVLKGVYRNSRLQTAAVAFMTALHSIIGTWKNKIDVYITLTRFAKTKFESAAIPIPPEKLHVKPNFVFDVGMGKEIRKDFFLYVGRLTKEKGIDTLLQAAVTGRFQLVIIGDGPLRGVVEHTVHMNPNISYMGFQDQPVVIDRIKTCKALIFPSVWYECFPMTILEAFSAGTVVIASKLGGMAEVIHDRANGLHFEPGNAKDLLLKIEEIKHDPELLRTLGAMARKTWLENYTPEKNYSLLIGIYHSAVARRIAALKNLRLCTDTSSLSHE